MIGRSEYLALPDWGIGSILAKVDTGARTSAIHVENLVELSGDRVRFEVVLDMSRSGRRVTVEAPVVKRAKVRSSSGHFTERCFVRTTLHLGPVTKSIDLSLNSRDKMQYRMLLGRQALARHFVVDVSKRHALSHHP